MLAVRPDWFSLVLLKCGIKEIVKKTSSSVHLVRDFVHIAKVCLRKSTCYFIVDYKGTKTYFIGGYCFQY
jgi:hypothetical protein